MSYLGEIKIFTGDYAPEGWAFCHGQQMSLATNQALYSLIGVRYGGDGRTNFNLPDLRGRVPVHKGDMPDGVSFRMGQSLGAEYVRLKNTDLPEHGHNLRIDAGTPLALPVQAADTGTSAAPKGHYPAIVPGLKQFGPAGATEQTAAVYEGFSPMSGSSIEHENRQPYLTVNFIICINGMYPPRG